VAGTVHVVIIIPNDAVRKILPAIAGLKILEPSPPKTILPIAIANALPIAAAHSGKAGGSENASIIPVTTALKSPSDDAGLGILRMMLHNNSVIRQVITQVAVKVRAYHL
jgi:hypothetical protein